MVPAEQTRCAVWGSPITHSLSPVLHRAAHEALGLAGWTYDPREVDVEGFPDALAGLATRGPEPLRAAFDAFALDYQVSGRFGGADVREVVVVGSGATARSAVAALASAGSARVTLMVRDQPRPETLVQARATGLEVVVAAPGHWPEADVVISTVPASADLPLTTLPTADPDRRRVLLDVVYGDGPTPLQRGAQHRGWTLARGVDVLLHQASRQVELMTGRPAPTQQMAEALHGVVDPVWGVRTTAGGP